MTSFLGSFSDRTNKNGRLFLNELKLRKFLKIPFAVEN